MQEQGSALPYLVFDSTFTQVKGLDELAEIAFAGRPDAAERGAAIKHLTDQGMTDEIGVQESLSRRLGLLGAHRQRLAPLVKRLHGKVSESIRRNGEAGQLNLGTRADRYLLYNDLRVVAATQGSE